MVTGSLGTDEKIKTVPNPKPTYFQHQQDSGEHMTCTCDIEGLLPGEKTSSGTLSKFPGGSENRQ